MKKYIAPVARHLVFEMESIIAMSTREAVGYGEASNERERSASEVIWGFDDEAQ